ncbi:hypothetical protein Lser_V15G12203 [Lactuca serriola]
MNAMDDAVACFTIVHCYDTVHDVHSPRTFSRFRFRGVTSSNKKWEKEFKIKIKFAARKDMNHLKQFLSGGHHDNPYETIQALDVVLRDCLQERKKLGRSLFSTEFRTYVLGDGVGFWKGFYQTLKATQMGFSLNLGSKNARCNKSKMLFLCVVC